MSNNTKAIAKLKKKSRKYPPETGLSGLRSSLLQILPAVIVLWLLRKFLIESDYMLKRESTKFFRFGSNAYGSNKGRKCDRMLIIAFGLIDREFDADYLALIRNAVRSTLKDSKNRCKHSENILACTWRIEIKALDATGWYQLSRGLFSLGYFRAAWVARENSLDLSISEGNSVNASCTAQQRRLEAHLERRRYTEVGWARASNQKQIPSEHLTHFETFLFLFEHGYINPSYLGRSPNRRNEDLFRALITARTVAIVGPGTPQDDCGEEIDSFETVIRIKFIGNEMLDARKHHGVRTDVSFINAISAMKLQENSLEKDFRNFRLILSNQTSVDSIGSVPIYEIEDDNVMYRTTTTSGLRTLKEVIKYSPSKLKLFGFDFYSTPTPYSKEMTQFYEESSWRFAHPNDFVADGFYFKFGRSRDFLIHDPVSNFCFAQNLYKAGLFDIEPYGKSILELTPYQYVERLEEMLGDW